jgi:hypothetical protein
MWRLLQDSCFCFDDEGETLMEVPVKSGCCVFFNDLEATSFGGHILHAKTGLPF